MTNVPLVDEDGVFVGISVGRKRLDYVFEKQRRNGHSVQKKSGLEETAEKYGRPHAHTVIYSKKGYILVQERSDDRKYGGGAIFPFHGGHLDEEDLMKARKIGKDDAAYLIGAARELKEEIGISVNPEELHFFGSKYLRIGEIEDLGYNAFVKIFSLVYDREKHGPKRFNQRVIKDLDFWAIEDVIKDKLFEKSLGEKLGGILLDRVHETSYKIKSLGYEHVLREMKGQTKTIRIPKEDRETPFYQAAPEVIKEIIELEGSQRPLEEKERLLKRVYTHVKNIFISLIKKPKL